MGLLVLTPYKPAPATPGDANQIANGFTAIEAVVNAITQANMGAGNKVTASAMSGGPPASPSDGDIWIALSVDANGTTWHFRYNAGSASAFKWEFIGGPPVAASVATAEALTVDSTWHDPATVGPAITVARAGDYFAEASSTVNAALDAFQADIGVTIGAGTPVDPLVQEIFTIANRYVMLGFPLSGPITAAAADSIRVRYLVGAGAGVTTFKKRNLAILPRRII